MRIRRIPVIAVSGDESCILPLITKDREGAAGRLIRKPESLPVNKCHLLDLQLEADLSLLYFRNIGTGVNNQGCGLSFQSIP